jgi:DNA polymerase (family 10)
MAIQLERAEETARRIIKRLKPYCERIEVAGSIRRRRPWVNDIDIVLIAKDMWNLHHEILGMGQTRTSGSKIMRFMVGDIQVDLYFAKPETWATLLLIRTGSAENNIRLASIAKKRGWHLAASGDGLFNENGKRIAGESEESIFAVLGLRYLKPEERG